MCREIALRWHCQSLLNQGLVAFRHLRRRISTADTLATLRARHACGVAFAVWLASSAAAMLYFTNHVLPLASSTPGDLSYTTVPTPGLVSVWVTQT